MAKDPSGRQTALRAQECREVNDVGPDAQEIYERARAKVGVATC